MKKAILLTALLSATVTVEVSAQYDDMYFTPTKKSAEEKEHYVGNTYYSGSQRSSDEYNRRSQQTVCDTDSITNDTIASMPSYVDDDEDDYRNTRNMGRFYGFASPAYGYMSPWGFYYDPWWYDQAYYWGMYDPYYAYAWGYPYYGYHHFYGYHGFYDPWGYYWGYPYYHHHWGHGGGHVVAQTPRYRHPWGSSNGSGTIRNGRGGNRPVTNAMALKDRTTVNENRSPGRSGYVRSTSSSPNRPTTTSSYRPSYSNSYSSSSPSRSSYSSGSSMGGSRSSGSYSGGGSRGGGSRRR